ncbi:hypothetical protein [Gemella sanguinis]
MKEDKVLEQEVEFVTELSEEDILEVSGGSWGGYLWESTGVWWRLKHDLPLRDDYKYYGRWNPWRR